MKEKDKKLGRFDVNWEHMDCLQYQFVPPNISRDRLEELFADFCRSYFKRGRILWRYVNTVWKSQDSWKQFLASLQMFLRYAFTTRRIREEYMKLSADVCGNLARINKKAMEARVNEMGLEPALPNGSRLSETSRVI